MAKAGIISTQDWEAAVKELAKTYEGVSASLSSNTLDGAKGTYEANKGRAYAGATAEYNGIMKGYYDERANEYADRMKSNDWQTAMETAGMLQGELSKLKQSFSDLLDPAELLARGFMLLSETPLFQKSKELHAQGIENNALFSAFGGIGATLGGVE